MTIAAAEAGRRAADNNNIEKSLRIVGSSSVMQAYLASVLANNTAIF
jgi:hypothetical protein